MTNKEKYIEFCKNEKNIPIFSQHWWLDSVCGSNEWDVVLIYEDHKIIASLPYYKKNFFFLKLIQMPILTQTMGPYIKYPINQSYKKKLSYEKKIFYELINLLPEHDYFSQNFHYNITNWLPFYWKGYKQTTRYTYLIDNLINLEKIFDNFSKSKKKYLKRSEKFLTTKFDLSPTDFYEHHRKILLKKKSQISYNFDLFEKIYKNGYKNNSARTIYTIDKNQIIHSALFIIWDKNSAYNLISSFDSELTNSGSTSLLIKETLKFVSDKTKKFDFEGSMIEGVESSFRQFGGIQRQYFNITKTNSPSIKTFNFFRSLFRD